MRRVVTSAYHAVGTPIDRIMLLGGWNSSRTVFSYYVENIELNPDLVTFFSWLKADIPAVNEVRTVEELDGRRPKKPRAKLDL